MIPVLENKFKNRKIIALHVDKRFCGQKNNENISSLCETDAEKVQMFLEKELPEIDADLIRIIEWRPSLNYYREDYVKLLSIVVDFIKRTDAEKRTTAFFGKRWIKNFFRNLQNIEKILLYKTTDIPVIVTGSGPSLEDALPIISKFQETCLVISASSSVLALSSAGIMPDIVITTDGGCWALQHIYSLGRNEKTKAVAATLCSALPSQCRDTPHLIINDGSFWQNIILHELSIPSIIIPQKGTVSASAIELAMILSAGNIYLAGMDLAVNDIKTHARPYGFDAIFYGSANRFMPFYSHSFKRSRLLHDGGSMNIYSTWFKNQLNAWPEKIFSLNKSNIFRFSLPPEGKKNKNMENHLKPVSIKKDPALFYKKGYSALLKGIDVQDYSKNLLRELAPLLFPGENNITGEKLKTSILEIANRYDKG